MSAPSSLAILVMCWKMSDRSWVFSMLKFGQCLLKYSSFVSLTRLESHLNVSRWLHVNALCRGIITWCFELGGPSGVALDMVPLGGKTSTRPGEGSCHLGLGECRSGRIHGGRHLLRGGSSLWKTKWVGSWCLSHQYVLGSYQPAVEFHRAGS